MHEESILIPYPLPPLRLKFAMHSFTTFFMHKYVFLYTHSIELIIWFFCLLLLFCICNNVCGKANRFVQWMIQIRPWICLAMSQLGPGFSSSPNKGWCAKSSFYPKPPLGRQLAFSLSDILFQTIYPNSDCFLPVLRSLSDSSHIKWEQQDGGSLSCNTVLWCARLCLAHAYFLQNSKKTGDICICDLPTSSNQWTVTPS